MEHVAEGGEGPVRVGGLGEGFDGSDRDIFGAGDLVGANEGEEAGHVRFGGGHVRGGEPAEEEMEDGGGKCKGGVKREGGVKEGESRERVFLRF